MCYLVHVSDHEVSFADFCHFFLWRKSIANQMYTLSIVAWLLVKQQCFFLSGKKVIVQYNHIHQVCFYSLKYLYSNFAS